MGIGRADLTTIQGLGSTEAETIRRELGVRTFRDFTGLSIDELSSVLGADHRPTGRDAIQDWLGQAAAIMANGDDDDAPPGARESAAADHGANSPVTAAKTSDSTRNPTREGRCRTMATGPIEVPTLALAGTIEAHLHESGGADPVNVLRTDQDWSAHTTITLSGALSQFIAGSWHIHLRLESMGPGGEYSFFDVNGDVAIPDPSDVYDQVLHVPAGKVTAAHDGTPYRAVISVTYRGPLGNPGPIAGYVDLGIVQFYDPSS